MNRDDPEWLLNFPPFYTLQPNPSSRQKQLDSWSNIILNHFQTNKQSTISIASLLDSSFGPFHNNKIDRHANRELITAILDELHRRGNLTWANKNRSDAKIAWKSSTEWAKIISDWAVSTGQGNSVFTIFELVAGDETIDEEFYGLDQEVVLSALKYLESQKKAELMENNQGVKFLIV